MPSPVSNSIILEEESDDSNAKDDNLHTTSLEEEINDGRDSNQFLETTERTDFDSLSPGFAFYHGSSWEIDGYLPSGDDQLFLLANDLYSPPHQAELPFAEMPAPPSSPAPMTEKPIQTVGKPPPKSIDYNSLKYITSYGVGVGGKRRLHGESLFAPPSSAGTGEPRRRLSTGEVMRVAGACYIQFATEREDNDPFGGTMLSTLTMEETQDVELAHLFLSAAEKVANKEYDRADRLLSYCDRSASATGNPVQRVVHHFAGALRERIESETGKKEKTTRRRVADMYNKLVRPQPAIIACYRHLPFPRITELTQVQAVVDNVASSTKIHLIDLNIRIGLQWIGLMQALSTRTIDPIELLRITAFGASQDAVAETGERLTDFAKTLKLPFAFEGVSLPDVKEIKDDMLPAPESGESVVVLASQVLRSMLETPDCLENLMGMIRRLNPCLMIVSELAAKHNSVAFSHQFIEALFYYSAWFDCMGDCMGKDDANRLGMEIGFLSPGIWGIVGMERTVHSVGMELWRPFFLRSGFEGVELSDKIMYQARLIVKEFACWSSCNFDVEDNCLTAGWKGTPLLSVSAWKPS